SSPAEGMEQSGRRRKAPPVTWSLAVDPLSFFQQSGSMVAQSIARRPKRAQHVETDDAVMAKAIEITEWARRHGRLVIGVAVALLVVASAFFWYRADQNRRLDEAAIAYLQVEQSTLIGDD